MNLKFHMHHGQTTGLQTGKIQPGRDSRMVADTKNSKIIKINFFTRVVWYIRLKLYGV